MPVRTTLARVAVLAIALAVLPAVPVSHAGGNEGGFTSVAVAPSGEGWAVRSDPDVGTDLFRRTAPDGDWVLDAPDTATLNAGRARTVRSLVLGGDDQGTYGY